MSCSKFIHERSGCALSSAFNIFTVPPTNVAIPRAYVRELLPVNTISESPYVFRHFSDSLWTDPNKIYIYFELAIEKEDGGKWIKIATTDKDLAPFNQSEKC